MDRGDRGLDAEGLEIGDPRKGLSTAHKRTRFRDGPRNNARAIAARRAEVEDAARDKALGELAERSVTYEAEEGRAAQEKRGEEDFVRRAKGKGTPRGIVWGRRV